MNKTIMKLIAIIIWISFGNLKASETSIQEKVTSYSSWYGCYSLNHPATWTREKVGDSGDIAFISPQENTADRLFENLTIWVDPLDEDMTLDNYFSASLEQDRKVCSRFDILEQGEKLIDGVRARWFHATACHRGVEGEIIRYYLVRNGRTYTLDISLEPGALDRFGQTFDQIINSFRFTCDEEKVISS